MYLVVSSTRMELEPVMARQHDPELVGFLTTGVGPVEAAASLAGYLASHDQRQISAVVNIGLGGAYASSGLDLLDLCLAEQEFFGDIGICLENTIECLDPAFSPPLRFNLDPELLATAGQIITSAGFTTCIGNFVTVAAASGTVIRGSYLRDKFRAICENMEGAAVARVCQRFSVPCLEIRCISNLVIDRSEQCWRTEAAVAKGGAAVNALLEGLTNVC